jgi:hypothetical protein
MQNISPSSLELPGVSATEVERERRSIEAWREEVRLGDDLTLAADVCFLSLDGIGFSTVEAGVALGER